MRVLSGNMSNTEPDQQKVIGSLIGYFKGIKIRRINYYEPYSFQNMYLADTDYSN